MGLFGGSKSSSSSTTTNYTTNTSQSLGDLSTGNIQSGGDVYVDGFYGQDFENLIGFLKESQETALKNTTTNIADSNRRIAEAYNAAYSGSSGIITSLRPVLMVGVSLLAVILAPKILKGL